MRRVIVLVVVGAMLAGCAGMMVSDERITVGEDGYVVNAPSGWDRLDSQPGWTSDEMNKFIKEAYHNKRTGGYLLLLDQVWGKDMIAARQAASFHRAIMNAYVNRDKATVEAMGDGATFTHEWRDGWLSSDPGQISYQYIDGGETRRIDKSFVYTCGSRGACIATIILASPRQTYYANKRVFDAVVGTLSKSTPYK